MSSVDGSFGRVPTGPLMVQPPPVIIEIPVEDGEPLQDAKPKLQRDQGQRGFDRMASMRNTAKLPKLDASGIPDVGTGSLNALRGGAAKAVGPTQLAAAPLTPLAAAEAQMKTLVAIGSKLSVFQADKLDQVLAKVAALIAKITMIPSSGVREMLMGLVNQILVAAAKGDFDVALNMCANTMGIALQCEKLCDQIVKNIHKLRTLDVQGPAGALLEAIASAAQLAMNAASSPQSLSAVADMTDRAVQIGEKLEGLKPGSREYNDLMGQLASILQGLEAMCSSSAAMQASAPSPQVMGLDSNAVVGGGQRLDEARPAHQAGKPGHEVHKTHKPATAEGTQG